MKTRLAADKNKRSSFGTRVDPAGFVAASWDDLVYRDHQRRVPAANKFIDTLSIKLTYYYHEQARRSQQNRTR